MEGENSYWPLTSAGSLHWEVSGANSHWLMAQAGSLGQPRGMPNFYWLMRLAASSYADEVASVLEACDELLKAVCSRQMQQQARSGHPGDEGQAAWGHEPS